MLIGSDHVEGEAQLAKKQQSFNDDGVIDKHEQKEIDRAHKRQLESRGRGLAQVKPYRTAKWMTRVSVSGRDSRLEADDKGIKERLPGQKPKTRERECQFSAKDQG